jgi:hypothetical protein
MKIIGVTRIYDNGEFVTIETTSGSAVHLPLGGNHSITIIPDDDPDDFAMYNSVAIDLFNG